MLLKKGSFSNRKDFSYKLTVTRIYRKKNLKTRNTLFVQSEGILTDVGTKKVTMPTLNKLIGNIGNPCSPCSSEVS